MKRNYCKEFNITETYGHTPEEVNQMIDEIIDYSDTEKYEDEVELIKMAISVVLDDINPDSHINILRNAHDKLLEEGKIEY